VSFELSIERAEFNECASFRSWLCVVCRLGAAGQVYGDSTFEAVLAEGGISDLGGQ
jgi:hypothetical protein